MKRNASFLWLGIVCLTLLGSAALPAADTLVWRRSTDRVDAEIQRWDLPKLLDRVASLTGWEILVEPGSTAEVSAKFKNLSAGEALQRLLGNLNYALLPQTNGTLQLLVFKTSADQATQLFRAAGKLVLPPEPENRASLITNELVVILGPKSAVTIEELARLLGAKIVGRADAVHSYRLRFENEDAVREAVDKLSTHPDVNGLDWNYTVRQPPPPSSLSLASSSSIPLLPDVNKNSKQIIIGLVDSGVQPLEGDLKPFFLDSVSVAGNGAYDPNVLSHGTAMAQVLVRALAGVMQDERTQVRIQPVDVYGGRGSTTTYDVSSGIVEAIRRGATVINLSLGTDGNSESLHKLIQAANQKGILFVAAAGNEAVSTPVYPAAYPEVMGVTGADKSKYNFGSFVDLIAPDQAVVRLGDKSFLINGTSVSSAYAAGKIAGMVDQTGNSPHAVAKTIGSAAPDKGK